MSELSVEIKRIRKSLLLKQADLAEIAGLSEKTIRNIEQNAEKVSVANLIKVLNVLGFKLKIESNATEQTEKGESV